MENNKDFLGTQPVGKLLFKLAIPTVIAQLINMLYNIVDRIFIGHIPDAGSLALTGVGVTMPIIMIVSAFAGLVSSGGAPRASISMGKGDMDSAEQTLGGCFLLQVIVSIVLTVVLLLFGENLLLAFGASENTIEYAVSYLNIYALGTLFVQLTLGMNAFVTAEGFTKVSMVSVAIGATLNIALDPIMIFGLNMGVRGAALATVISQAVSCIVVVAFLCSKKSILRLKRKNLNIKPKVVFPCIALGTAAFIMQASESVISVCFNSSLLKYGGDIAVGAMTILTSVMQFAMLPLQGIAQGAQPITSYNYGANRADRIRKTVLWVLMLCVFFTAVMFIISRVAPQYFVRIFTDNAEYRELSVWGIKVFTLMVVPLSLQYVFVDALTALGMTKLSLGMSVVRKVFYFSSTCFLPALFTAKDAFYAEPVADILAASVTSVVFFFVYRKYLKGSGRLGEIKL